MADDHDNHHNDYDDLAAIEHDDVDHHDIDYDPADHEALAATEHATAAVQADDDFRPPIHDYDDVDYKPADHEAAGCRAYNHHASRSGNQASRAGDDVDHFAAGTRDDQADGADDHNEVQAAETGSNGTQATGDGVRARQAVPAFDGPVGG